MELWTLCRKPLEEKTVAQNVLKHGTGGINIDECRVATEDKLQVLKNNTNERDLMGNMKGRNTKGRKIEFVEAGQGRFPANLIHDGSEEVVEGFPISEGKDNFKRGASSIFGVKADGSGYNGQSKSTWANASRFFYCAKASKSERNKGLEGFEEKFSPTMNDGIGVKEHNQETATKKANNHPTVKPINLMRYLCRLITPKGGIILDPFVGSGTTGIGAKVEGFDFIGIEREEEYCKIAEARIEAWETDKQKTLF